MLRHPDTLQFGAAPAAQQHAARAAVTPNMKTLYLIRHGEGWHNIGFETNLDPHLTPRGWAQTAALQQHLATLQPKLNIELVVVSPLRRTLETAAGVFGAIKPPMTELAVQEATASDKPATGWVLMHPQVAKQNEISERAQIYLPAVSTGAEAAAAAATAAGARQGVGGQAEIGGGPRPLPLLANDGCRERIGPNVCDKFRDIPLQVADFPGIDFSSIEHIHDDLWEQLHNAECRDGGCYRIGEEEIACEQRALEFYRWLLNRPESRIAVVSHCGFLVHGMRAVGKGMLKVWNEVMLQKCIAEKGNGNTAVSSGVAKDSHAQNGSVCEFLKNESVSEALRQDANVMHWHIGNDWANCEMRSISIAWVDDVARALSNSSSSQVSDGHFQLSQGIAAAAAAGHAATAAPPLLSAAPFSAAATPSAKPASIKAAAGGAMGKQVAGATSDQSDNVMVDATDCAHAGLWAVPGDPAVYFPGGMHGV